MPTNIEWTRGDDGTKGETWNPLAGCTPISPGCQNCYAATMARRLEAMGQAKYVGTAERRGKVDAFTGRINLDEAALTIPLKWKKPRRVFVNSMSDLFHENVSDEFIDRCFAVMALATQHTFQILTKRPERMCGYFAGLQRAADEHAPNTARKTFTSAQVINFRMFARAPNLPGGIFGEAIDATWPLPNVWIGTSVEDQQRADERIPHLLNTPAAVRFISAEPLLGPIDLAAVKFMRGSALHVGDEGGWEYTGSLRGMLNWVICGGESGHHARPMHPDWAMNLRDQCINAKISFHFKQWGEWQNGSGDGTNHIVLSDGRHGQLPKDMGFSAANPANWHTLNPTSMCRVGKKAAGRLLDGRTWDEFPTGAAKQCKSPS